MLKILDSTLKEGTYKEQYFTKNGFGEKDKPLDYRGIVEYKGFIYNGKGVPHTAVFVQKGVDTEACESCGGLFPKTYCTKTVRDPRTDGLETLCNNCRLYSDNPTIRDTSSSSTCGNCEMNGCNYHPSRNDAPSIRSLEYKPAAGGL